MGGSYNKNSVKDAYLKQKFIEGCTESFPILALPTMQEQSKKCICKLFLKSGGLGTGFFCKIPFPTTLNLLPTLIATNYN